MRDAALAPTHARLNLVIQSVNIIDLGFTLSTRRRAPGNAPDPAVLAWRRVSR
jgi:hypothetical protein